MGDQLPEDVLINIISRLAPRYLAVSRCVCKTWCAIIDACNMLRADLLPHSVRGIFINFHDLVMAEFFSRPSKGPALSGYIDFLPSNLTVDDHCNGLLLLHGFVVNPATRQWAELPPRPRPSRRLTSNDYLVFDPTLSPHYEVFMVPILHCCHKTYKSDTLNSDAKLGPAMVEFDWPSTPCILDVFSSRTKQWEERSFVLEGEAAGEVADMYFDMDTQDNAVFWRGVLYVNCSTRFIMRISPSNGNYRVIKPPEGENFTNLYLGKSEKGVYCALTDQFQFRIYILDESSGKMEWLFKHLYRLEHGIIDEPGPWTLQDLNHLDCEWCEVDNKEAIGEKFDWDSDSDNVIDPKSSGKYHCHGLTFLGFHPYKEVIFIGCSFRRGLAYHLNSSKTQDLGNLCPTHYEHARDQYIYSSFPYTPWLGEFPGGVY